MSGRRTGGRRRVQAADDSDAAADSPAAAGSGSAAASSPAAPASSEQQTPASEAPPSSQGPVENSDDEGEDLNDEGQLARDYMPVPELDRYDAEDMDAEEYSPMSPSTRMAAEQALNKRDRNRRSRGPRALRDMDEDEDLRPSRRRRREREEGAGFDSSEPPVNIEDLPEGTSLTAFIQCVLPPLCNPTIYGHSHCAQFRVQERRLCCTRPWHFPPA